MIKIFILALFFCYSTGDPLISCDFISSSDTYTCFLTLNNSDGFDNFVSINGEHLRFFNDSLVTTVNTARGISPNLPKIICEKFKNLQRIILYGYGFEFLTLDALEGCKNLETLNLFNNSIQLIDANTFNENLKLSELYLGGNNLITLHGDTLKALVNLRILNMNDNPFLSDFASDAFDGLENLEEIYLENTGIDRLQKNWFDNLGGVKKLHLEGNRIQTLPTSVFSGLSSLEYLWIHNNRLQVLQANSFTSTLTNLHHLYAHSNRIIFIDQNFFNLVPNLSTFDLTNNFCINQRFSNFTIEFENNLEYFTNCFENFDDTVRNYNPTCRFVLHQEFGYTCEFIEVNYEEIGFYIVADHPPGLTDDQVRGVIFTNSRLSKIPPMIFDKFPSLSFLEAKNVNLKNFTIENCNKNLHHVDLSQNSIRTLYNDAFKDCRNLTTILLNSNGLNKIQPCLSVLMNNHPNLERLSLIDNDCVDGDFDNLMMEDEDAEEGMKKCFAMWHLM